MSEFGGGAGRINAFKAAWAAIPAKLRFSLIRCEL
jgi:hypothetical protein